jgi:hypothetical protein
MLGVPSPQPAIKVTPRNTVIDERNVVRRRLKFMGIIRKGDRK